MRLRRRLILSILSVALSLAVVCFISVRENRAIENEAESLLLSLSEDAEGEVSRAVRDISAGAASATRVVMIVSAAAVLLTLVLAFQIGSSVARPVEELRTAAVRVGEGELETRVVLPSRDEFGELAASFNQMAEELGRKTVTKSYLDEVINTMTGALIIVDPARKIRSTNRAAQDLLGYDETELRGQPLDLICPEDEPANTGSLIRLSADGRVRNLERKFLHRDGTTIPVLFSGSTLRSSEGRVREFVCVAYDISISKKLEQRLRSSLREKELLLREVHHRVKNNLQIISSLLDLQSEHIHDPRYLELVKDSRNRIRSMALIHEQLYRTDDLSEIQLGAYLENIIAHLFRSFGIEPGQILLRTRIEELSIDLDRSIACGLIINELVSNSLKHAFPEGKEGEVRIEISQPEEHSVRLLVSDNGSGLDEELDLSDTPSMGLTLVTMMVRQLRGTLDVQSEVGTEFRIDFPYDSDSQEQPRAEGEEAWPARAS